MELLVVIGIIGMLVALLVPAVQSARETARANDCRNNLKNWALAVTQFDLNRGHFPGFLNDVRDNRTAAPNPGNWGDNSERSWMFVVLPYMDNRALYDREHDAGSNGTPNLQITHTLEVAICKSNPPVQQGMGQTSYAANVGQVDRNTGNVARAIPTALPTVTAGQTKDGIGNGVFHFRGYPHIPGEILVTERGTYISSNDGQTNTILLSENVDSFMWSTPYERFGVGYCSQADTPGTGTLQALAGMPWKISLFSRICG